MPSAPDYATIGEFYELLTVGLTQLSEEMGEKMLFIGPVEHQLRPDEIGSRDLSVVSDLATATRALHLIIVQGEGAASSVGSSHFEEFSKIKREYEELVAARQEFCPSRNVACNPVMRRPISDGRVHVTHDESAPILDAANAVYSVMLRCLTAVFDTPSTNTKLRQTLIGCAFVLMKCMASLSDALTRLPARADDGLNAGIPLRCFAAPRVLCQASTSA